MVASCGPQAIKVSVVTQANVLRILLPFDFPPFARGRMSKRPANSTRRGSTHRNFGCALEQKKEKSVNSAQQVAETRAKFSRARADHEEISRARQWSCDSGAGC